MLAPQAFLQNGLEFFPEPIARMNVEWKVEKAERPEFNMPTCGNIGRGWH